MFEQYGTIHPNKSYQHHWQSFLLNMRSHSLMLGSLTINQSTKNPEVWVYFNNVFEKILINNCDRNQSSRKTQKCIRNFNIFTQEGGSVATVLKSNSLIVKVPKTVFQWILNSASLCRTQNNVFKNTSASIDSLRLMS